MSASSSSRARRRGQADDGYLGAPWVRASGRLAPRRCPGSRKSIRRPRRACAPGTRRRRQARRRRTPTISMPCGARAGARVPTGRPRCPRRAGRGWRGLPPRSDHQCLLRRQEQRIVRLPAGVHLDLDARGAAPDLADEEPSSIRLLRPGQQRQHLPAAVEQALGDRSGDVVEALTRTRRLRRRLARARRPFAPRRRRAPRRARRSSPRRWRPASSASRIAASFSAASAPGRRRPSRRARPGPSASERRGRGLFGELRPPARR